MKKAKKLLSVLLASTMVLSSASTALACTGIYVGSEFSANGSTYMGRSEDIGDLYGKMFGVAEAAEHDADEVYKDTYGFSMTYGEFPTGGNTYRYTYVKDTPKYGETMKDADGNYIGEAYAEAGINEHSVAMSATVSTSYGSAAKAADKLPGTGICEVSLGSLILGGCKTAREAVEFLAYICDTYGAGECNSITISDPEETWIFDTVSGHQYVAVKMPEDKVHFNPNISLIDMVDVNDTENVVASPDLINLAVENGFLSEDSDAEAGLINVAQTYKGNRSVSTRYAQGMWYLNPELAADSEYMATLPFMFEADRELTTMEVLRFLATYGEGTPSENLSGQIGNNRQSECHIFEIRENMPDELAIIQWQAMADAEFSIYIPYYSALVTEVHEGYDYDEKAPKANRQNYVDEALLADTEGSINWNFQIINHYCFNNREALADEVKAFFAEYQESLIDQQKAIDKQMKKIYKEDKELAAEKATELGKDLADQVLEVSTAVLDEILEYLAGDQTEPFKLSKSTLKMEPEYDFDRIGGTGLEEEETTVSANKPKNYSVNVDTNKAENGTVVLSKTRVKAGGEVTVTVTPDEGYKLKSLSVLDKNGDKVKVAEKADGRFVFEMPKGGVEVVPVFVSTSAKEEAPVVKAEPKEIVLTINQVVAKVLGETVVNDVAPIIRNGRTVLPARFVVEALGGNIAWDEAAQKVTITKDDTTLEIFINEPFATVNGTPVQLDAPAFIENSRTYLPLRFIAEYLDAEVTWNEAAQTVTIVAE